MDVSKEHYLEKLATWTNLFQRAYRTSQSLSINLWKNIKIHRNFQTPN